MEIITQEIIKQQLPTWQFADNKISKEFVFKNFMEAFAFMSHIALLAEKMDHHPNWSNVYNKVSITLFTHSKNCVTNLDLELATKIDSIIL